MSVLNLGNIWQPLTNITMDGDTKDVLVQVGHILTTIFNSIMCSFTDALNVLVIMAVKRRSRLQSYNSTLLACLAVADELSWLDRLKNDEVKKKCNFFYKKCKI